MTQTVVALFDDIAIARQVIEDLVNAEFSRNSISLITNDANNQYSHYLDKDYSPKTDAVNAAQGAGFGVAIGALTGILAGLASLLIPGIGAIIVAGPIAAGLTGLVAGAITGGIVGALVKSGVPEDEAPYYAEGIRRGGTLISVQVQPSDTLRAEDIMNRHGAVNIHQRINSWKDEGWTGFASDSPSAETAYTDAENAKSVPIIRPVVPLAVAIPDPVFAPSIGTLLTVAPVETVMPIAPVIAEPVQSIDDTAKSPLTPTVQSP